MRRDAEEVAFFEGGFLVSFEGEHRTQTYRVPGDSEPRPGPLPTTIRQAARNSGMEAVTPIAGGLLVVTEGLRDRKGRLRAWLGDRLGSSRGSRWRPLKVESKEGFMATAAATLPDGDVLLLQRFYSDDSGVRVRLLRLSARAILRAARHDGTVVGQELSRFQPPLAVDNFEALDVETGPAGQVFAYLLADDNYSETQRTLLFQVELGR